MKGRLLWPHGEGLGRLGDLPDGHVEGRLL